MASVQLPRSFIPILNIHLLPPAVGGILTDGPSNRARLNLLTGISYLSNEAEKDVLRLISLSKFSGQIIFVQEGDILYGEIFTVIQIFLIFSPFSRLTY